MKLYQKDISNYSARTRVVIYEKNLDVEMVPPPGGLFSDEYRSINPLGKIPALEVNGRILPESRVINEFLEDVHPRPSMLPAGAEERARVRLLSRFHDLYFEPPVRSLYLQHRFDQGDEDRRRRSLAELDERLPQLSRWLPAGDPVEGTLTLADAALAPTFLYLERVLPALGAGDALTWPDTVRSWWDWVREHRSVQRALDEMNKAFDEAG